MKNRFINLVALICLIALIPASPASAILVTSLNFPGTMTLPFMLVASIVLPLILIPTARWLGKRNEAKG